jgi:hypothetical protein
VSPTFRFTATTVPSMGLPIVAWFIACSDMATSAAAASTDCWSAARSAADGDEPPPLRPPVPPPPEPVRDWAAPPDGPVRACPGALWLPLLPGVAGGAVVAGGAEVVGGVVVGGGVWSARCCSSVSSLFDASTRAFCFSCTTRWASCTAERAC